VAATPLILAAGASRRMGRPKAGLAFGETTALGLILFACREAGLQAPVVVAGAHGNEVRRAAGAAHVVQNSRWESGRTSSIQAGLAAISGEGPVLLWPVDVCLPGVEVVRSLLAARRERTPGTPALAWVPSHDGRRGHPVLLEGSVASRMLALGPDTPVRTVIHELDAEGALVHVLTKDASVLMDMNTPEDYERWRGEYRRRRGG